MRRFITTKENAENVGYNPRICLATTEIRQSQVFDSFFMDEILMSDGSKAIRDFDVLDLLLDQRRLDQMGPSAAKAFIDSLDASYKSNALDELRKKCSDEDLHYMIKSKHLQSPAEILCWARYMNENVAKFNSELEAIVKEQQPIEKPSVESVTPTQS